MCYSLRNRYLFKKKSLLPPRVLLTMCECHTPARKIVIIRGIIKCMRINPYFISGAMLSTDLIFLMSHNQFISLFFLLYDEIRAIYPQVTLLVSDITDAVA